MGFLNFEMGLLEKNLVFTSQPRIGALRCVACRHLTGVSQMPSGPLYPFPCLQLISEPFPLQPRGSPPRPSFSHPCRRRSSHPLVRFPVPLDTALRSQGISTLSPPPLQHQNGTTPSATDLHTYAGLQLQNTSCARCTPLTSPPVLRFL